MSTTPLSVLFDELQGGLESLLSCFETRCLPEPASMDAAWMRVQRSFESVCVGLDHLGRDRDSLRERVDHCLRLYAVAAGVLAQRREELAAERTACTNARQRLRHVRSEGRRGSACDVRA
ncbi:MAG: hypothetical protein HOP15_00820 [Planctomycetes bacterium]|nr:hypothetical protein [Planctomycetota bacterium]